MHAQFAHPLSIFLLSPLELPAPSPSPSKTSEGQLPEPDFVNLLRSPGIDSQPGGPVRQPYMTYRPRQATSAGGSLKVDGNEK